MSAPAQSPKVTARGRRRRVVIMYQATEGDPPQPTVEPLIGGYNIGVYCQVSECREFSALFAARLPPPKSVAFDCDPPGAGMPVKCRRCGEVARYHADSIRQLYLTPESLNKRPNDAANSKVGNRLKLPKKCIFCGTNNANSKEHFYPNWIGPLLRDKSRTQYLQHQFSYHATKGPVSSTERIRQGQPITRKHRVVCVPCNTGWMKAREESCAAILRKFAVGEEVVLSPADSAELARWAVTKALLLEHSAANDTVTPPKDRKALMEDASVPSYYRVYLGAHDMGVQQGMTRHSTTFFTAAAGRPVPALDGMTRNTQQVTFLLGHAFFHVTAARIDNFDLGDLLKIPELSTGCHRIFPMLEHPVLWPPPFFFAGEAVDTLAHSLEATIRSGLVPWLDEVPD